MSLGLVFFLSFLYPPKFFLLIRPQGTTNPLHQRSHADCLKTDEFGRKWYIFVGRSILVDGHKNDYASAIKGLNARSMSTIRQDGWILRPIFSPSLQPLSFKRLWRGSFIFFLKVCRNLFQSARTISLWSFVSFFSFFLDIFFIISSSSLGQPFLVVVSDAEGNKTRRFQSPIIRTIKLFTFLLHI